MQPSTDAASIIYACKCLEQAGTDPANVQCYESSSVYVQDRQSVTIYYESIYDCL